MQTTSPRRRLCTLGSILLAPLAACSDEPTTITIAAGGTEVLALQGADGSWRALETTADGTAVAEIDGPFTIAAVCDNDGFVDVTSIRATAADATDWQLTCAYVGETVTIESVGDVPLFVYFGGAFGGDTITVPRGTFDLIAFEAGSDEPRFVIQRDIVIDGPTTVTIDLEADGAPLELRPVEYSGGPNADVVSWSLSGRLLTADGTFAVLPRFGSASPDLAQWVVPAAALEAGDHQTVAITMQGDSPAQQRARVEVSGGAEDAIVLRLPAPMTSASLDWDGGPSVTWDVDGAWGGRILNLSQDDDDGSPYHQVSESLTWIAETGADETSMTALDPTTLPGWQARWAIDPAGPRAYTLSLDRELSATASEGVGWSESAEAPDDARVSRP
jgi:hypothetical protein